MPEMTCNPEMQVFDVFILVPTMLASQKDIKLKKLPVNPKNTGSGTDCITRLW